MNRVKELKLAAKWNVEELDQVSIKDYMSFMRSCIELKPTGFLKSCKNMSYIAVTQQKKSGLVPEYRMVYLYNDTKHMCSWLLVTKSNMLASDRSMIEKMYGEEETGTVYKLPYISRKHIYQLADKLNIFDKLVNHYHPTFD